MLTTKQEKFVQSVVFGEMNYSDAYRFAYNADRMSDKTVNEKASLLANEDKIRARITELREQLKDDAIMTAKERLKWLTSVIRSDREKTDTKLKAVDIMNKMTGEYVTKVQGDLTVSKKLEDLL